MISSPRPVWDIEPVAHHEAVELRLGEFKSSALLHGILSCYHYEGRREFVRLFADRHLSFLHRFQEKRFAPWEPLLISSARSRFVKIGPLTVTNSLAR